EEVFCSSLTFSASANPIVYEGGRPVFIDSERASWNMDPLRLGEALADRAAKGRLPRAVIVVHLYGQCADLDPWRSFVQQGIHPFARGHFAACFVFGNAFFATTHMRFVQALVELTEFQLVHVLVLRGFDIDLFGHGAKVAGKMGISNDRHDPAWIN
ncbi:MAG: DegT/DnrJ/EryC1/StrS family aminotransferase, partial [Flavobacteriales bacterium]|nr:DegT/DnrJ/EryC1/StrS family aminotransferase [Flavobacteriales bacterium]